MPKDSRECFQETEETTWPPLPNQKKKKPQGNSFRFSAATSTMANDGMWSNKGANLWLLAH